MYSQSLCYFNTVFLITFFAGFLITRHCFFTVFRLMTRCGETERRSAPFEQDNARRCDEPEQQTAQ